MAGVFIFSFGDFYHRYDHAVVRIICQHRVIFLCWRQRRGLQVTPLVLAQIICPGVRIVSELRAEQDVEPSVYIINHVAGTAKGRFGRGIHAGPRVGMWVVNDGAFPVALSAKKNNDLRIAVPRCAAQRRDS